MSTLILLTDIVEKIVLLGLFGLSIWSLTIIIDRRRLLEKEADSSLFLELKGFLEGNKVKLFIERVQKSPETSNLLLGTLRAALENQQSVQSLDRAVASSISVERMRLEKGLAVLGTLGANAPFIGLFGTVLGIIRAFAYLGTQGGSAAVMTGVSQALYATALGLFVAIPAVVFFNLYSKKIKSLVVRTESLRDLLVAKKDW